MAATFGQVAASRRRTKADRIVTRSRRLPVYYRSRSQALEKIRLSKLRDASELSVGESFLSRREIFCIDNII